MILRAVAHGPLVGAGPGEIIAAFASSAYLQQRDRIVCLLGPGGPNGAIHARVAAWPRLERGQHCWLDLQGSVRWQPPAWPVCDASTAHARLWRYGGQPMQVPEALLGRGEGLTPRGDDVLAGWLMARTALRIATDASVLLEDAQYRTHAISCAHLAAAAKGIGAAPFHDVLAQILDPLCVVPDLRPLDTIGASSGHAAFEGVMAALCDFIADHHRFGRRLCCVP